MTDNPEVKKYLCLKCCKPYTIIVFASNETLSATDINSLKNQGIIVSHKGKTIKCPNCEKPIQVR